MKLYIGVTNNNELYYIEWDKVENEQRKTFSLSGGLYDNPKTEQQGEDEARDTLKDSSYWDDIGLLNKDCFLNDFINFDDVADHVINADGWENTNGEYSYFGEYQNEEIYLNDSSGGQHQEELKDFKELWISKPEFKTIMDVWNRQHLKPLKETTLKYFNNLFEKYKVLSNDEEALIKYLDCIKWRQ